MTLDVQHTQVSDKVYSNPVNDNSKYFNDFEGWDNPLCQVEIDHMVILCVSLYFR